MAEIDVRRADGDDPLEFEVTVSDGGSTRHRVRAARSYVERLSRPGESPEDLVSRCFAFLLEREPKESILAEFELPVIERYFPGFEREISR